MFNFLFGKGGSLGKVLGLVSAAATVATAVVDPTLASLLLVNVGGTLINSLKPTHDDSFLNGVIEGLAVSVMHGENKAVTDERIF